MIKKYISLQKNIVKTTEKYSLKNVIKYFQKESNEEPFMICNIFDIWNKINVWEQNLPNVKPYYAMKCNPDETILKLMIFHGMGFDCASKNEINKILSLGGSSENIIFANPCKIPEHVEFAKKNNVVKMTFDSVTELYKIKKIYPDAQLLIRIQVDDSKSVLKFNSKFGVSMNDVDEILKEAKSINSNIVGVSFHVGSGCHDENVFYDALKDCKTVYNIAKKYGFQLNIVDIGGGFPGDNNEKFKKMSSIIETSIKEHFEDTKDVKFIAEPGRYMVASAFTLVTNVIHKKYFQNQIIYYLSEGVYGSFNNIISDKAKIKLLLLDENDNKKYKSIIYGPSCDSYDIIFKDCELPELEIDDTIYVENMGAYTVATSSTFNGFPIVKVFYYVSNM